MHIICTTLNAKYIHTNLAIRYLKAYAAPEFHVELVEYTIKDPVLNIVTDLYRRKPDVVGFSCYIWNIEQTIEVIQLLKKVHPTVTIVVGGPEVSYDVAYWLERVPQFDYIVIGEGEETFKQLLTALQNGDDVANIAGLAFHQDGKPVINPQRNKINLANMPSPFRFPEDIPHLSKRVTYVETSRGCPFSCQFCLSSIEVGVRYFDREKIKEDLRYLMKHGAKVIKFVDRTFNISRSYAMDMFQFLIDEHVPGVVFQFEITADIMRPEVIEFLNKEAPPGLFRFEIGVQSTNDEVNKLVMRKQNFEKLTRTVTMVKQGGKIAQHLDLIAGLPEEDYTSFRKTFNDVFALRPEELQLGFLKMLRGTGLRRQADEYGYVFMDRAPYEMLRNRVLSFDDVIRLKQVEDVLEKYWNDHRMDETIEYIVTHLFDTPFDFFQSFGTYWDEQGWARIGHQLEDLFRRLYSFLQTTNTPNLPIVEALMKYDYLRNQKQKPRKPWWDEKTDKHVRARVYEKLSEQPHLLSLSEKELFKHTVVEMIPFDLPHYLQTKQVRICNMAMIVYFNQSTMKAETYFLEMEQQVTYE